MAPAMTLVFNIVAVVALGQAAWSWAQAPPNTTAFSNTTCLTDDVGLRVGAHLETCPEADLVILSWVTKAVYDDPRMPASLLRLHFHDCFVNGCDASVLLDDTPDIQGEKGAAPNLNSLRGFEVIDAIKSELEALCPGMVSCADILAIAARDSVMLSRGPVWEAETGRRDGRSASLAAANNNLPAPNASLATLATMFGNLGLSLADMVALSGGHTVGKARCSTFSSRLKETNPAENVNLEFLETLNQLCSSEAEEGSCSSSTSEGAAALAELDLVTPATFDNQYYVNLLSGEGLLASDQVLVTQDVNARQIVSLYAEDENAFFRDFTTSMIKMGRLSVLTGNAGEIRRNCRLVNPLER